MSLPFLGNPAEPSHLKFWALLLLQELHLFPKPGKRVHSAAAALVDFSCHCIIAEEDVQKSPHPRDASLENIYCVIIASLPRIQHLQLLTVVRFCLFSFK